MALTALPDVPTAHAHIAATVHQEGFLAKLASLRPQYMPQTREELNDLLQLGAELAANETKTASAQGSRFGIALQGLHAALGHNASPAEKTAAAATNNKARMLKIGQALAANADIHACATVLLANQARSHAAA